MKRYDGIYVRPLDLKLIYKNKFSIDKYSYIIVWNAFNRNSNHHYLTFILTKLVTRTIKLLYNYIAQKYLLASSYTLYT